MRTDEFITKVLNSMYKDLTGAQLDNLKSVLYINLTGKVINDDTTELALTDDTSNDMMLEKFIMNYQLTHSETTVRQYYRATFKFLSSIGKRFDEVTTNDVECYLAQMKMNGASGTHLDNTKKYITAFYNWTFRKRYIISNPCDSLDKIQRNPIKKIIITDYEMAEIRDNISKADICEVQKLRDMALLDFLYSTGVRVGELTNLKDSEINLDKEEAHIYAHKTNKWRITYLNANAVKHYKDYRNYLAKKGIESEYAFINIFKRDGIYKPMTDKSIEETIQKYCNGKRFTVHNFRKTLGTNLSKKGVPAQYIQQVLGHSDISVTMKNYVQLDDSDVKYALSKHLNN